VQIVKMANGLPCNVANFELAKQIIRSGTGIGANVEEADAAESKSNAVVVHGK
jgi:four helix bundle protein